MGIYCPLCHPSFSRWYLSLGILTQPYYFRFLFPYQLVSIVIYKCLQFSLEEYHCFRCFKSSDKLLKQQVPENLTFRLYVQWPFHYIFIFCFFLFRILSKMIFWLLLCCAGPTVFSTFGLDVMKHQMSALLQPCFIPDSWLSLVCSSIIQLNITNWIQFHLEIGRELLTRLCIPW